MISQPAVVSHLSLINNDTNAAVEFQSKDWPVLVHGTSKSGALLCTVIAATEAIRRGQAVVLLCSQGGAIRAVQRELDIQKSAVKFNQVTSAAVAALEEMQLVTLFKRRGTELVTSLRALKDWGGRLVIINNVEDVLTPELWAVVRVHQLLLLSGNFDQTKVEIDPDLFHTHMLFSEAPGHWQQQRSTLPTYLGDVYQGTKRFTVIVRPVAN